MQIRIEKVGGIESKEGRSGKPYQFFEVIYNSDGRIGKKILFPKSDAGKTLINAFEGEEYEVLLQKNGEYWEWLEAKKQSSEATQSMVKTNDKNPDVKTPVKSTYETSEERAKRQVLIVRQSSLSNALVFSSQHKTPFTKEQVLALAEEFADFVFEVGYDSNNTEELEQVPVVQ